MTEIQINQRSRRQTAAQVNYYESDTNDEEESTEDIYAFNEYTMDADDDSSSEVDNTDVIQPRVQRNSRLSGRVMTAASNPGIAFEVVEIPNIFQFNQVSHCLPTVNPVSSVDYTSPISIFNYLFDAGIQKLYAKTIIKYRELVQARVDKALENSDNSRPHPPLLCSPLSLNDIRAFIGAILMMDIYQRPELKNYWGLGKSVNKFKPISDSITYSKFSDIRACIGVEDENYLIQLLCKTSRKLVSSTNELSIDEQLRLFTGRYANKIVMKDKPAGCGIKCIGMADSNTKLPLWWSTIGLGEEQVVINGMNKYSAICASFLSQTTNKYVFIDNLYTTQELHEYCYSKDIKLVGTVRSQNLPKPLKELFKQFKKIKRDDIYGYCDGTPIVELVTQSYIVGNVYYIFVLDNGAFCMSTNCQELFEKGRIKVMSRMSEKQRIKFNVNTYKVYKLVPYIVAYYNKKMNGVDVIDQLIVSHERHQRQSKWTVSLIYTAIKMAETTSFTVNKW